MDTYLDFCKRCSQGMVGYRKDFYVLSNKYGDKKRENRAQIFQLSIQHRLLLTKPKVRLKTKIL